MILSGEPRVAGRQQGRRRWGWNGAGNNPPACGAKGKDEVINFVMQSSDVDSLIIAAFVAGMQAKKNTVQCFKDDPSQPRKPPADRPA